MTATHGKTAGSVCLVGAGPGDPGLITAAGLDRLRRAEVVVYDALVNAALLREAPRDAELIDAGKRAGRHKLTQEQTNELMLDRARRGRFVVRLKGGDPYLFGRGAEEVVYLARHGVRCEVIPGVTAAVAGACTAGIPVTHRQVASSVTFVTGHEDPTKEKTAIDYAALAALIRAGGTVCFYMGVGRLPDIITALSGHGLDATTPAAIVQWATLPRQTVVRGELDDIADRARAAGIGPPSVIIMGHVADLDEPGLDFFINRPLFGRCVLVTRTRRQASALVAQLAGYGAEVIEAPTIDIAEPESWESVDHAIRRVAGFDWLVLTSANGVSALADRLDGLRLDARHLAGPRIAVIGQATADALHEHLSLRADLIPPRAVAESLAEELISRHEIAGKRVLLLRARDARSALPSQLRGAGAHVEDIAIYQTTITDALPDEAIAAFEAGRVDWVTFTSSSTARNLVGLLGDRRAWLDGVKTASIGPVTSATLRELGLAVTIESPEAQIGALVGAMIEVEAARYADTQT